MPLDAATALRGQRAPVRSDSISANLAFHAAMHMQSSELREAMCAVGPQTESVTYVRTSSRCAGNKLCRVCM